MAVAAAAVAAAAAAAAAAEPAAGANGGRDAAADAKPEETTGPPPPGWRLATAAELRTAGFRVGGARAPEQNYYSGHAGWDRVGRWGGVGRDMFVTTDWAEVDLADGGAVDAGQSAGDLSDSSHGVTAADLRRYLPGSLFAGVVCVRAAD